LEKAQARAEQQAEALADARVAIQTAQARVEDLAGQVEQARKDAKAAGEEAATLRGQIAGTPAGAAVRPAPAKKTPKA
jgi:chromosome segregation ATPase